MSASPEPQDGGYLGPTPTLQQPVEPDSCIKILLATDNHIGYAENDPVRGRDSINTFREILQLAVANDVDMLLLAGDLFHENRPSRTALYQTMAALREFTMGPRPVSLEVVSEAGFGIKRDAAWPTINYEDENMNVGLPIFSIHGNHDDPQGTGAEGALCALDLLTASGFINYFGRLELPGSVDNDEDALGNGLQVKPVLLQKGDTKLALYGMGNIRDERFHFEMRNKRIQMFRPSEDPDDWFNVILVHQNRVAHGPGRNVVDTAFGDEAHLVVWGHEHDCIERATPQPVSGRPYYIVQPGSSIATSLAKGESIPKHVSLVKVQGKEFEFEPIRLRSVRPFIFEEISLAAVQADDENVDLKSKVAVTKYLKMRVNQLIDRANEEWDELHADDEGEPEERLLPLIRIRVDYSHGPNGDSMYEIGNPQRFGQDFVDRVANPRDIVQFHRRAAAARKKKVEFDNPDEEVVNEALAEEGIDDKMEKLKVSTLVAKYLEAQNLGVLPEGGMQRAVEEFVDKGDKDAIPNLLKKCLKLSLQSITATFEPSRDGPEHDDLGDEMEAAKQANEARYGVGDKKGKGKAAAKDATSDEDSDADMKDDSDRDSMASSAASSAKGKKKAAPKKAPAKAAAKKAPAKGKGKGKALFDEDSDDASSDVQVVSDDDDDDEVPVKKKAPAKKAVAVKKAAAPKVKAPARKAAVKATKQAAVDLVSSDDSSAEEAPARKKKR